MALKGTLTRRVAKKVERRTPATTTMKVAQLVRAAKALEYPDLLQAQAILRSISELPK